MKRSKSLILLSTFAIAMSAAIPMACATPAPTNASNGTNEFAAVSNSSQLIDLEDAKQQGMPVVEFLEADNYGFNAQVANASIEHRDGSVEILNTEGDVAVILNPSLLLRDGTVVDVEYVVENNRISAHFSQEVQQDQVLIMQPHGSIGACLGAVGTTIALVSTAIGGVLSAPVTGPAGPLYTIGISTGLAGGAGAIAISCGPKK